MARFLAVIFIILFLYPIFRGNVSVAPIWEPFKDLNSLTIGKIFDAGKTISSDVAAHYRTLTVRWFTERVFPAAKEKAREKTQQAVEEFVVEPAKKTVTEILKQRIAEFVPFLQSPGESAPPVETKPQFPDSPQPEAGLLEPPIQIGDVIRMYEIPVLVLKYFPMDGDRLNRALTDADYALEFVRAKVDRITKEVAQNLSDGTRYKGYKDPAAKPSLVYKIVEEKEFLTPVPKSSQFPPFPDHFKMFEDANIDICDKVENEGIKEVWIWMYHTDDIAPIESNMAGPYGDISNSYRHPDLPVCDKTYVVYEFNYTRGTDEAMESYGHQIEAVFRHVDHDLFWNKFVGPVKEERGERRCGNVHNPPNSTFEYDRRNLRYVETDCPNWMPEGGGERVSMNCDTWDCDITQWHIWWMQNIPGRDNGLAYKGKTMRNWWEFIGNFDAAMGKGKSFTE